MQSTTKFTASTILRDPPRGVMVEVPRNDLHLSFIDWFRHVHGDPSENTKTTPVPSDLSEVSLRIAQNHIPVDPWISLRRYGQFTMTDIIREVVDRYQGVITLNATFGAVTQPS